MKRAKIHFYKINGIVLFFLRIFMQKVLPSTEKLANALKRLEPSPIIFFLDPPLHTDSIDLLAHKP